MKENKLHLVPQPVIDCAENIFNPSNNSHMRDQYIMRLEAIRDYCDEMLRKTSNVRTLHAQQPRKNTRNFR